MADVGKTTDMVDITANRVEDEQEDVDKKVEQSSFSFTGGCCCWGMCLRQDKLGKF